MTVGNKSEIAEREIRHHTCQFVDTETDPPLMIEQEYDGSLEGDWKKFMCPVCHDRIILRVERAIAESQAPQPSGYCGDTGEVACSSTNYMSCPACSEKQKRAVK